MSSNSAAAWRCFLFFEVMNKASDRSGYIAAGRDDSAVGGSQECSVQADQTNRRLGGSVASFDLQATTIKNNNLKMLSNAVDTTNKVCAKV